MGRDQAGGGGGGEGGGRRKVGKCECEVGIEEKRGGKRSEEERKGVERKNERWDAFNRVRKGGWIHFPLMLDQCL